MVHAQVVSEEAELPFLGERAQLLNPVEALVHVDRVLVGLAAHDAALLGHGQQQRLCRFVQMGHVHLHVTVPLRPVALGHEGPGEAALVRVADLVAVGLGSVHFRLQLLLQLFELAGHVWFEALGIHYRLLLDTM